MLEEKLKLTLHTKFSLSHFENVERLVMALTLAGFYVRIAKHTSLPEYNILVYRDR